MSDYNNNESTPHPAIEENLQEISIPSRKDSIDEELSRIHGISIPSRKDSIDEELSRIHGISIPSRKDSIDEELSRIHGEGRTTPVLQEEGDEEDYGGSRNLSPLFSPTESGQVSDDFSFLEDLWENSYGQIMQEDYLDNWPSTSKGLVPGRIGIKRQATCEPQTPNKVMALEISSSKIESQAECDFEYADSDSSNSIVEFLRGFSQSEDEDKQPL